LSVDSKREQTRARYPDEEGFVERDGVRVFWERYGEGDTTIFMVPRGPSSTPAAGRVRSLTSPATTGCW